MKPSLTRNVSVIYGIDFLTIHFHENPFLKGHVCLFQGWWESKVNGIIYEERWDQEKTKIVRKKPIEIPFENKYVKM